jgi:hypothetical protein
MDIKDDIKDDRKYDRKDGIHKMRKQIQAQLIS